MTLTVQDPYNHECIEIVCGSNEMLIVDPYLVNIEDFVGANEGSIIRLRRPAWGKHILDKAVKVVPIPLNGNNYENELCEGKSMSTKTAYETLRVALQSDSSYAWGWHCNIAMSAYDAGCDYIIANKGAASFMQLAFGVDTTKLPEYRSIVK